VQEAAMTRKIKNVCVYCGSGTGLNPEFAKAARTLGCSLAEADIGLVYGGGTFGLMGEIARATLAAGGHVTGIIPEFLQQRELAFRDIQKLILTKSMHERKQLMFEHSDAFIALPGGVGTLEELIEQMTWSQLGQHSKPLILANLADYWRPLIEMLERMRNEDFIRKGLQIDLRIVNSAEEILPAILSLAKTHNILGEESAIPERF